MFYTEDLKECPFCGEKSTLYSHYYCCCNNCGAQTKLYKTEKEAKSAWNTRKKVSNKDTKIYGSIYEILQPLFDWLGYNYPSDDATFVVTHGGAQMFINHGPQICNQKAFDEMKAELPNMINDLANRMQNKEAQHAASNEEIERN